MGLVKCEYVVMTCRNGYCWNKDMFSLMCEGMNEDAEYVQCRDAVPVRKYIEGEYKRIEWDGETLTLGKSKRINGRYKDPWIETEAGIDYLEIDGRVIIDERPAEKMESKDDVVT